MTNKKMFLVHFLHDGSRRNNVLATLFEGYFDHWKSVEKQIQPKKVDWRFFWVILVLHRSESHDVSKCQDGANSSTQKSVDPELPLYCCMIAPLLHERALSSGIIATMVDWFIRVEFTDQRKAWEQTSALAAVCGIACHSASVAAPIKQADE